jgi:protoporphyrinogen oxidase
MANQRVEIAILGGGIAGLGAHFAALRSGIKATIYEARRTPGGLLDNFSIEGFRFDQAVHLSFASEPLVREIFDQTPYWRHSSTAYCYEGATRLKHPVQNNLYPLPIEDRISLIKSFLQRPESTNSKDYESWLRHQYGDQIADRFPLKYTHKYWDTPARNLSTTWIGDRMRRATLEEILAGAMSADTPNHYYAKEMRYPKTGGYRAFLNPLLATADIKCGHRCIEIDTHNRKLSFANGEIIHYDTLLSTLPLPELPALCKAMPQEIEFSATQLVATSVDLISIGMKGTAIRDLWLYIYDDDIYASRAYSPSVKSPANAPDGHSSLQFEIYNRGTRPRHSPAELRKNTLMALERLGISAGNQVLFVDHRRIRYGNVIFELGMETHRENVISWCDSVGVHSCGRFGAWDYLWSNQSFLSGYNKTHTAINKK